MGVFDHLFGPNTSDPDVELLAIDTGRIRG